MRILILSNLISYTYNFRLELIEALIKRKDEVIIASDNDDDAKWRKLEKECELIEVPFDGKNIEIKKELRLLSSYRRIINKVKPEVVLSFTIKMNLYGGLVSGFYNIPYIPMITGLGELEKDGKLKDTTWEEYKSKHADPVKVTDVDQDLITSVQNATGISQVSFLVYEQPEFIDKTSNARSLSDILQIVITVLIFALLGFVVFKSTRSTQEEPQEEEISVDSLLEQTTETNEPLEDIGYSEKSETRLLIEKFVDENPEAAALLLRNWLNEDWE